MKTFKAFVVVDKNQKPITPKDHEWIYRNRERAGNAVSYFDTLKPSLSPHHVAMVIVMEIVAFLE